MKIALRTSGGRGEYELAGSQAQVRASDLLEHDLMYQITPELRIPGHSRARRVQGKPRIRLNPGGIHFYRIVAALLLLPQPKRAWLDTPTTRTVLIGNEYSLTQIDVDVAEKTDNSAVLCPSRVVAANRRAFQTIEFPERMGRVAALWNAATQQTQPDQLSQLLRRHRDVVVNQPNNHTAIKKVAKDIVDLIAVDGDPLPEVERRVLGEPESEEPAVQPIPSAAAPPLIGNDDDDTPAAEAARRQITKWRLQASRGSAGRKFSEQVKQAYNYQCAVSGERLPKLECTASSGVEAAHILPWNAFDLNSVHNGICLSKACHWAFDAGLIRLDFNEGRYLVSIPANVRAEALAKQFSLDYFDRLLGPIAEGRLPPNRASWPNPDYLTKLNERAFGR